MLIKAKIEIYEDDKLEHLLGDANFGLVEFSSLEKLLEEIRAAHNLAQTPCHFKITAVSYDY
jgi:hypothetical protein